MAVLTDPFGRPAMHVTESPFPGRLFDMLSGLSDTLSQQGIELRCVRCGQPLQGANHEADAVYTLTCGCRRSTFDRHRQRQKVDLHETVTAGPR